MGCQAENNSCARRYLAIYRQAEPHCSDKVRTVIQDILDATHAEKVAIITALSWTLVFDKLEDTPFKEWLEQEWEKAISDA